MHSVITGFFFKSFSERLTFNYESGDLEIIEENEVIKSANDKNQVEDHRIIHSGKIIKKILSKRESGERPCTAKSVKRNLEYNIKTFIGEHSKKSAFDSNRTETRNHSFREIESMAIKAKIEPIDIKDPRGAKDSRKFVVNTKYEVQTFEKPKSIRWLRIRRLSLFLQSIFYSEYKLAKILLQCKFNGNG
jgi:hypothetical protein